MTRAYLKRMPAGIPGDVSRKAEATIEAGLMAETVPYGCAVKLDSSGKLAKPTASTDTVHGFMARPYPTQDEAAAADTTQDCMLRGYMTVKLARGTAARGGQVYVRVTAVTGKAVGDIEAAPDTTESATRTLEVPNCIFMGAADANGNVEISFNL